MMKKGVPEEKKPSTIKWESVLERLEKSKSLFEEGFEVTEEEKRKTLKTRAKKLAKEPVLIKAGETYLEVLEFLLAYERYAIETRYIREVYPMKELTVLPCTPSFLLGVINVRGQLLSVIDIKKFFDLPEKGLTNLNRVIIAKKDKMELGILSDEIIGVRNIPYDGLQLSLPTLSGIRAEYLKGVTSERLIVLDVEKLLTDKKIIVNEEVEK